MKKGTIKLIIAVLMLVTICLYFVSGTYARYAESITGNANVTVAKWAVAFKDGETTLANDFNLNFKVTDNTNVVSGKVAPGTSATATIEVDLTGTEVAVDYEAVIDEEALEAKFNGADVTVSTSVSGSTTAKKGTINLIEDKAFTETNGKVPIVITLTWNGEEADSDDKNGKDTAMGKGATGTAIELPVTLKLQQHIGVAH